MEKDLKNIFSTISSLKVGVIGDFALDVYFDLEKETGELSLETGKPVHYGTHPTISLGGAGNIIQNLHALGAQNVVPFGIYNDDLWGRELMHQLQSLQVETSQMVLQQDGWDTCVYMKPMLDHKEESRIDFGARNAARGEVMQTIFDNLEKTLGSLDVLIINRQFKVPLIDNEGIDLLNKIAKKHTHCAFFADMRAGGGELQGITLKANVKEAASILGASPVGKSNTKAASEMATELANKIGGNVLLTRGESGIVYVNGQEKYTVNGIHIPGEKDIVGAGDTAMSVFAACTAAGASPKLAIQTANMAAAVTITKLGKTGVAHPDEILSLQKDRSYIYYPDIAAGLRKAQYVQDTDIEIIRPVNQRGSTIEHVIFDHDGTISTLRQGWEQVMLPVMIESICGDSLDTISQVRHEKIAHKVRRFIDESTGIQTIAQMQGLVKMVYQEELVPQKEVKSAGDYKAIYLEALMGKVLDRIRRLKKGERKVSDFTVRGAVSMVEALSAKDIRLYMASGTDEEDVKREADMMGYAHMFSGGIYGSKGNKIGDAKKIVINRILDENACAGKNLMIVGDGPVEMREGRKVGALCIGVASDEVRRYGLNEHKRTRLIRAGAQIIVPDFTQRENLFSLF